MGQLAECPICFFKNHSPLFYTVPIDPFVSFIPPSPSHIAHPFYLFHYLQTSSHPPITFPLHSFILVTTLSNNLHPPPPFIYPSLHLSIPNVHPSILSYLHLYILTSLHISRYPTILPSPISLSFLHPSSPPSLLWTNRIV